MELESSIIHAIPSLGFLFPTTSKRRHPIKKKKPFVSPTKKSESFPFLLCRAASLRHSKYYLCLAIFFAPPLKFNKEKRNSTESVILPAGPGGVYSTHSPVSRTEKVSVRLRMRTSFPSAHSPFIRFSKQRRKGGLQVPRALCPTHLSRSKCSSPVPPNAPISRQRSCECAVMLRMLRHRIDQPSSPSFPVHSLYISDTQGRTRGKKAALASVRPIIPLASCIHASV
ncbi:hypothetical protein Csa_021729 [Cucumis sativus]|nr:hypothetical protein Csa_021729 [Cucumis sativus]